MRPIRLLSIREFVIFSVIGCTKKLVHAENLPVGIIIQKENFMKAALNAISFFLMATVFSTNCYAAGEPATKEDVDKAVNDLVDKLSANNFFSDWSVGLVVIKPKRPGINSATLVSNGGSGVVRVDGYSSTETGLILARHFFPFRQNKKCTTNYSSDAAKNFFGSFCVGAMIGVGISPSSSDGNSQLINFVGGGVAIGSSVNDNSSFAWNVGVGLGVKYGHRTLADGFYENNAPPVGETSLRYKITDVSANFMYFSIRW